MQQINVIIKCKLVNKLTKLKLSAFLLIGLIVVNMPILKNTHAECVEKQTLLVLQSNCACNRWQKIIMVENQNCEKDYSGKHFDKGLESY